MPVRIQRAEVAATQDFDATSGSQTEHTIPQQISPRTPPVEEPPKRLSQTTRRTNEHQDATVLVGESILAQEVLIVGHEEKTPRTPVDLGIGGVSAKAILSLSLSDLAVTGQVTQLPGDINLNVMV